MLEKNVRGLSHIGIRVHAFKALFVRDPDRNVIELAAD
jgi:hypothetical protein